MLAGILKLILPSLEGAALKALFAFIGGLLEKQNLITQGATAQALGEAVKEVAVQKAMAQAAANAPTSKTDAMERLKDGSA